MTYLELEMGRGPGAEESSLKDLKLTVSVVAKGD